VVREFFDRVAENSLGSESHTTEESASETTILVGWVITQDSRLASPNPIQRYSHP
jgi:hypothetical protein